VSKNKKIIILSLITISIPLTIILVHQIQNYRNYAAEPARKMALGISMPYGFASKDINTDVAISEIEKLASPVTSGGVGAYPASYSIWTDFAEGSWKYSARSKFPNAKLLDYLDSKKITPMIFMDPVGPDMRKTTGTIAQAQKYSNQSIINGAWDSYLTQWATEAKAYKKPVILRYGWEMNGTWFPWSPYTNSIGNTYYDVGNTSENYVASWRHIYNIIKPIAPNVMFYWCPNAVNSAPNAKMASFYPGNNYVDYVGFDEYNWYPKNAENLILSNAWKTSIEAIRHIVTGNISTHSTIPIIIGETGVLANNEFREEKLNYNTIYNSYPDIKSIVYFDIDVDYLFGANAEPGINWRLSGKSENPAKTNQGVDLRPKYNTFVVQEKFQGNLNPAYEIPEISNPIISPTNTPTLLPTKTPTQIISPTKLPTPSPTKIPNPTPIISQAQALETKLNFTSIKLHGLGNSGDITNPSALGNMNPLTRSRTISIELLNSSGALSSTAQGNITYSTTLGYFSGEIILNSNVSSGNYIVKIKSDKYLKKQLTGIISIVKGSTINLPLVTLSTGDSNNDNKLNTADYNIISDCYSDLLPAKNCSDAAKKTSADLSDDGNVNSSDYNLFLRELSEFSGD